MLALLKLWYRTDNGAYILLHHPAFPVFLEYLDFLVTLVDLWNLLIPDFLGILELPVDRNLPDE
jgi:hypothetical protein